MAVSKSTTFSESNVNISANTMSLTITVYFSANNNQTYTYDKTLYCTCNGITQSRIINLYAGGSVSESFTFDNIEGGSTVNYSWSCATLTSVLGNISDNGTHTVSTIPRYAEFTEHYVSSTSLNSISVYWKSDSTIDHVWYKINGGSWVSVDSVNTTSGSYTISNLNPNTKYDIITCIRRKDSQLETNSSNLSATTKDIGKITKIENFEHGSNINIEITNPSGSTLSLVMKIGNTTIFTKNVSTSTKTISVADTELDKIYKLYGSSNTLTATFILSTANAYTNSKTSTITLNGNQKTIYKNISGNWHRGKVYVKVNNVWRKGVVWKNINGTWRRCA